MTLERATNQELEDIIMFGETPCKHIFRYTLAKELLAARKEIERQRIIIAQLEKDKETQRRAIGIYRESNTEPKKGSSWVDSMFFLEKEIERQRVMINESEITYRRCRDDMTELQKEIIKQR